jgi:hypothetical protein
MKMGSGIENHLHAASILSNPAGSQRGFCRHLGPEEQSLWPISFFGEAVNVESAEQLAFWLVLDTAGLQHNTYIGISRPYFRDKVGARDEGQGKVNQSHVYPRIRKNAESLAGVARDRDPIPLGRQQHLRRFQVMLIVVDEQNFRS